MNEQRERMERALRECAEQGVPDTADLWPRIQRQTVVGTRRSRRIFPRTRVGWVFAVLAILLFGTGAYAASTGMIRVDRFFLAEAPGVEEAGLSVRLDQTRTIDGVAVSLVRAYADADNVVVGFSVSGPDGRDTLAPQMQFSELTDESGTKFLPAEGSAQSLPGEMSGVSNVHFFEPERKLSPDSNHRFRLKINAPDDRSAANTPFVLDFEAPVRPISTAVLDLDQEVESNGVTLVLRRVAVSPAGSYAILCPSFDVPDDGLGWMPVVKVERLGEEGYHPVTDMTISQGGCATMPFPQPLYGEPGHYRLTVTEIRRGMSQEDPQGEKTPGPWKFNFEVPEP